MGKMLVESAFMRNCSDSMQHNVSRMDDYGDSSLMHDDAARDGFLVVDGRCNNPDCCRCTQERLAMEIEEMLEQDEAPLQIDTREAQAELLLTVNPVVAVPQGEKYYLGEHVS